MTVLICVLVALLAVLWIAYKRRVEQDDLHDVERQREEHLKQWADEQERLKQAALVTKNKGDEYEKAKQRFYDRAGTKPGDGKGDGTV